MTATTAQVAHYRALAAQAQGRHRETFRSHWMEGDITVEYEMDEGRAVVQEIYAKGSPLPLFQFLTDQTVLHVGDELDAHLAKLAREADE